MVTFEAKKREILGKEVQKLRREGFVPGVLVERRRSSVPLLLEKQAFLKTYREAKDVPLADLRVGEDAYKVIVSEVQYDPLSEEIVHINFRHIHEGERLTTTVPIRFEGESEAVARGEALLLVLLDELEIECLPKDLPSEVAVDVSGLGEIGEVLKIEDLDVDLEKIEVLGHEPEDLVAKLEEPEMEELEEIEEEEIFGFEEEFAAEEEEEAEEELEGGEAVEGEEIKKEPGEEVSRGVPEQSDVR